MADYKTYAQEQLEDIKEKCNEKEIDFLRRCVEARMFVMAENPNYESWFDEMQFALDVRKKLINICGK